MNVKIGITLLIISLLGFSFVTYNIGVIDGRRESFRYCFKAFGNVLQENQK